MKIKCQIEPSDYVKAQYLHARPRPLIKWVGIILIVAAFGVGLQAICFPQHNQIGMQPFILLGVPAYIRLIYGVWLPYRTRKLYGQQKALQQAYEVEITDEDITSTHAHGKASMKWADFHKYKVGREMLLVYQSDALFHIFPKRWFSDEEYRKLTHILQNSLGNPKT